MSQNQPELDDRMFEAPQAVKKLRDQMAPDIVKRWQKDAKHWVRDNAIENAP